MTHPWEVTCPTLAGSPDPPLRGHSSFRGSLGNGPWKQKPSLPPRGPRDFPCATLPNSSQPLRYRVRRKDMGTGGLVGVFSMGLSKGPVSCVAW